METKITHYEDEIKKVCIKRKGCTNYAELITKFLSDYKGDKLSCVPYGDPDCKKNRSYYDELAEFLTQQEELLIQQESERFKYFYSPKSGIIAVSCDGKADVHLKSDQFGFSVNDFEKYPYGWFYRKIVQDNKKRDEEKKKIFELIANCIYDTRTLGGGFLWPSGMWEYYNKARGGTSKWLNLKKYYIEDRVDLTLLEIKHLFEWICEEDEQKREGIWAEHAKGKKNIRPDIIFKKKIKNDNESIEWLKHFGTFKRYIEFFCFKDFMVEGNPDGMPLDIVKSVLSPSEDGKSAKIPLKDPTEYKERGKHSIYRLSELEMMNMLKNVRILTLRRSWAMQDVVNQYRKKRISQ